MEDGTTANNDRESEISVSDSDENEALQDAVDFAPNLQIQKITRKESSSDLQITTSIKQTQPTILPPRDTGFAAWQALCAAILVQAIIFSFPMCFGVFQDYFEQEGTLSGGATSSWIGLLSTGVSYIGAPAITYTCEHTHFNRQYYVLLGWFVCVISLVAASFCTALLPLALTQGLLYGIGVFIVDVPVLIILNTWFLERRGIAYGILFSATDVYAFGMSFLAEALLHKYGLRVTLLSFAAIILTTAGPSILFLKERGTDPLAQHAPCSQEMIMSPIVQRSLAPQGLTKDSQESRSRPYYLQPLFHIFALANLLQSLAFEIPLVFLPSFTTDLGFSSKTGATVLAIANIAQIFGELVFGQLSDKVNVSSLVFVSSGTASIAAFTLWGLASSLPLLIAFALVFGASASGLIALWARMGTFFGEEHAQMVYSVMSLTKGVGNIASSPISSALLGTLVKADTHRSYANGKYFGIVLYVGICMGSSALLGAVGIFAARQKKETEVEAPETCGPI